MSVLVAIICFEISPLCMMRFLSYSYIDIFYCLSELSLLDTLQNKSAPDKMNPI